MYWVVCPTRMVGIRGGGDTLNTIWLYATTKKDVKNPHDTILWYHTWFVHLLRVFSHLGMCLIGFACFSPLKLNVAHLCPHGPIKWERLDIAVGCKLEHAFYFCSRESDRVVLYCASNWTFLLLFLSVFVGLYPILSTVNLYESEWWLLT
jgi:hypothetical protein